MFNIIWLLYSCSQKIRDKNYYDSTRILSLSLGYYLYNWFWNECYYKYKKSFSLGDDNDNKCINIMII